MSLGKVSVVQIALAQVSQCSWDDPKPLCAVGTFLRIFSIGNLFASQIAHLNGINEAHELSTSDQ